MGPLRSRGCHKCQVKTEEIDPSAWLGRAALPVQFTVSRQRREACTWCRPDSVPKGYPGKAGIKD